MRVAQLGEAFSCGKARVQMLQTLQSGYNATKVGMFGFAHWRNLCHRMAETSIVDLYTAN